MVAHPPPSLHCRSRHRIRVGVAWLGFRSEARRKGALEPGVAASVLVRCVALVWPPHAFLSLPVLDWDLIRAVPPASRVAPMSSLSQR